MERQGWRDGSGLGSKLAGISQPVTATGSSSRTGLGYKGEPLPVYKERNRSSKGHDCKSSATKSGRTFHISTIFDEKPSEWPFVTNMIWKTSCQMQMHKSHVATQLYESSINDVTLWGKVQNNSTQKWDVICNTPILHHIDCRQVSRYSP